MGSVSYNLLLNIRSKPMIYAFTSACTKSPINNILELYVNSKKETTS